jgi:hypothetical protein
MEISSCARVDAKPIDRDKQITYDIAKYGEGPLKKIPASAAIPPETISSSSAELPPQSLVEPTPGLSHSFKEVQGQRKRKLSDLDQTGSDQILRSSKTKSRAKGKRKAKEKATLVLPEQEEEDAEHVALSVATPERHPGLDERLKNLETHLALRYGSFWFVVCHYYPAKLYIQQCLHLLEHCWRDLSSWKTMSSSSRKNTRRGRLCILINRIAGYVSIVVFYNSFFQLNRYFTIQWPPPPRATPVIVPPQLRSNTSFTAPPLSSMNLDTPSTPQTSSISSQPGSVLAGGKPRKVNSSLHKAVLERLEVQRAISEMGGKGSQVP